MRMDFRIHREAPIGLDGHRDKESSSTLDVRGLHSSYQCPPHRESSYHGHLSTECRTLLISTSSPKVGSRASVCGTGEE